MLNISENKLNQTVDLSHLKSYQIVAQKVRYKKFYKILRYSFFTLVLFTFLPWTQNIRSRGFVTTLRPEQRPQTVQSAIAGRVEKWFVQEGDFVKKGDTIMFISEIKDDYFDPKLLERTASQVEAKSQSVGSYEDKIVALDRQISALTQERILKLEQASNKLMQAKLKVQTDSIDLEAAKIQRNIAQRQYDRVLQLQNEGLKAVIDVEDKNIKLQENLAKLVSQENKLLASRNEVINAQIEISSIDASYNEKISKASSEKFTAISAKFEASGQVDKLKNQFANYEIRTDLHYIRAPQDGYINKAIQKGIGETFKEGSDIVNIMPSNVDLAVETFVNPMDLPLLHKGEKVRIIFDGWPAIVFSGWPNMSFGTYGGVIIAVERFISPNGKYRVLIAPDSEDNPWPEQIRAGSGSETLALLENVPIWYEIWRHINGFPANYYQPDTTKNTEK
ncbi:MAG: HlyD family efflux transporter periplasmic adaptor subunit [Flavobacteriaceae bacterium]|nr:HlyD family efflux transporter periplasmic adaptor subunit [Flavobacteriaceae bacterium]